MKNVHLSNLIVRVTILTVFISTLLLDAGHSQTFNDGPIELKMKVREIDVTFNNTSDANLQFGGQLGFTPDEHTFKLWGRDNADVDGVGWGAGTGCLTENFNPPQPSQDWNLIFFDQTYTGTSVPQFLDLRIDAWEDEGSNDNVFGVGSCDGDRCTFEGGNICCGEKVFGQCLGLTNEQDDRRCNGNPYKSQLDYRQGPPCQWYDHGFQSGNCSNNNYLPKIETFWRYTKGDSCSNPIPLGTINPGDTVSHFNSNECYTDNFGRPGKDVFYEFTVNSPVALNISLCGSAGFDTYMFLLNNNCVIDTFNNDFCGNLSRITKSLCNPGTYKVVVDGNTASAMGTFTLTIEEDPTFSFSVNSSSSDVTCNGAGDGTASVAPAGGTAPFDVQWSTGDTTNAIDSLAPGTYSVTVTDATGCQASDTTTISEPSPLTATLSKTDVSCSGANDGTATVTASGGTTPYSYEWSTIPVQTTDSAIFLNAGFYTVTVTDANGCQVSENIRINTATAISINVNQQMDVACFGEDNGSIDVSASGGNPPYDYIWSNGDSTSSISGLEPGNYSLTVFDFDDCNIDTSLTIVEPDSLALGLQDIEDVKCRGDQTGAIDISTSGGTKPYNYNWSNNSQKEDQLALAADTFAVTVTDENGCTDTLSNLEVRALSNMSTALSGTDPSCHDTDDGRLEVMVMGGDPPYDFFWSDFSADSIVENAEAGTHLVVVEDQLGCQTMDSITLIEPQEINSTFSVKGISCIGQQDGAINLNVSGGTQPYSFNWSNGATSQDVSELGPGNYTVTVTDDNNCSDTSSVFLESATEECVIDSQEVFAIQIPNAFSPNNDGRNDEFTVLYTEAKEIHLKIFNRWGELIYENPNVVSSNSGWDGMVDGEDAPVGSYIYVVDGRFKNGKKIRESGSFVLLR